MISLRTLIVLFGLIAIAWACAPHMPRSPRDRGYCKFYIDGTSDFEQSARKKRDSDSDSDSSGSGSSESGGKGGKGGKGGGGGGGGRKRYNRLKQKDTKCYEYEDGTKDQGAELKKGVTYDITITRKYTVPKPVKGSWSSSGSGSSSSGSSSGGSKTINVKETKTKEVTVTED